MEINKNQTLRVCIQNVSKLEPNAGYGSNAGSSRFFRTIIFDINGQNLQEKFNVEIHQPFYKDCAQESNT